MVVVVGADGTARLLHETDSITMALRRAQAVLAEYKRRFGLASNTRIEWRDLHEWGGVESHDRSVVELSTRLLHLPAELGWKIVFATAHECEHARGVDDEAAANANAAKFLEWWRG